MGCRMAEVMLRPGWPGGRFSRNVTTKKGKARRVDFVANEPVKLTDDEYLSIASDIGVALYDVERDAKGRPRLMEPAGAVGGDADPSTTAEG